jgi:hypothetical protein
VALSVNSAKLAFTLDDEENVFVDTAVLYNAIKEEDSSASNIPNITHVEDSIDDVPTMSPTHGEAKLDPTPPPRPTPPPAGNLPPQSPEPTPSLRTLRPSGNIDDINIAERTVVGESEDDAVLGGEGRRVEGKESAYEHLVLHRKLRHVYDQESGGNVRKSLTAFHSDGLSSLSRTATSKVKKSALTVADATSEKEVCLEGIDVDTFAKCCVNVIYIGKNAADDDNEDEAGVDPAV